MRKSGAIRASFGNARPRINHAASIIDRAHAG